MKILFLIFSIFLFNDFLYSANTKETCYETFFPKFFFHTNKNFLKGNVAFLAYRNCIQSRKRKNEIIKDSIDDINKEETQDRITFSYNEYNSMIHCTKRKNMGNFYCDFIPLTDEDYDGHNQLISDSEYYFEFLKKLYNIQIK